MLVVESLGDSGLYTLVNTITHRGRQSLVNGFKRDVIHRFGLKWPDIKQSAQSAMHILVQTNAGHNADRTIRSALPVAGWAILSEIDGVSTALRLSICAASDDVLDVLLTEARHLANDQGMSSMVLTHLHKGFVDDFADVWGWTKNKDGSLECTIDNPQSAPAEHDDHSFEMFERLMEESGALLDVTRTLIDEDPEM